MFWAQLTARATSGLDPDKDDSTDNNANDSDDDSDDYDNDSVAYGDNEDAYR